MATNKIQVEVTMQGIYSYEAPAYGYGMETRYIYNMVAKDGTVYVWKTTVFMGIEIPDENGNFTDRRGRKYSFSKVNKGDKLVIAGSVKGQGEYKGQPQTELTRVKVKERTFEAETWEMIQERRKAEKEAKAEEQRGSLTGKDFIWTMPYKQYKEHYSDCETVTGSYNEHLREREMTRRYIPATIDVIIREGRLKNSGVRGEHYSGYEVQNENGMKVVYRAVKEENAIRRAEKEFGGEWKCTKIYHYDNRDYWY